MKTRRLLALVVATAGVGSCIDATDVELLEIEAFGALAGVAYLDANGNAGQDGADQPLENVRVDIVDAPTQRVVEEVTTGALGVFLADGLPVGSYDVRVAADVLGDSLTALALAGPTHVELGDTALVAVGVSYPSLDIAGVRAAPAGTRVFTSGIALNARPNNSDGQVHLQGATAFLRAINVARATGGGIVQAGDSVRLLGRTGSDNGQPVLDDVTAIILIPSATVPVPEELTTAEAASAAGGGLDAALVNVRHAEITDTATSEGAFHVWVDDGSGPLEMVFRSFLAVDPGSFPPDTTIQVSRATGLLSPFDDGGTLRWRLLPRTASDVTLELGSAPAFAVSGRYSTDGSGPRAPSP